MKGFSTRAVHAGECKKENDPVIPPIYQSSTFVLGRKAYEAFETRDFSQVNVYTRLGNPTLRTVEEKIASLEGCESGLVVSSGMGGISSVIFAMIDHGSRVLATRDIYGGTYGLFKELPRYGITVDYADQTDPDGFVSHIKKETKLIYLESITNPTLKIAPLNELVKVSKETGIPIAIDNTFATPYNLRPFEHGVDIVIHSATKYLNGHSDIIAGAVATSRKYMEPIRDMAVHLGTTLDPHAAFLLLRGLKTFALRMERHNSNAMAVAEFLSEHPKVRRVIYPGLPAHPQHELAKRMLRGFGGVVTFDLDGSMSDALRFLDSLKVFAQATSLGGVESLASMPVNTSHAHIPEGERLRMGISDSTIRLSVGIEDADDLIEDLDSALKRC
jgi:cystathionine beta-lyase/cystathionine gamma-synthase